MDKKFIVETSARHIHLSQEDLETLFGKGYQSVSYTHLDVYKRQVLKKCNF